MLDDTEVTFTHAEEHGAVATDVEVLFRSQWLTVAVEVRAGIAIAVLAPNGDRAPVLLLASQEVAGRRGGRSLQSPFSRWGCLR